MRKIILLLVFIFGACVVSNAQVNRSQSRDAEWKSYALPKTNFARQMSPEKEFIFRVPADWKQQGTALTFEGPHTAELKVFVQKVPDGYSLQDFFASFLQTVKDTPGAAETVVTRKIQLQDLEARELVLELPAAQLDAKSPVPYTEIAMTQRKQARWAAALKAAQKAMISITSTVKATINVRARSRVLAGPKRPCHPWRKPSTSIRTSWTIWLMKRI